VEHDFTPFYRARSQQISATLVLTGSTPEEAKDLTADAFIRAWERWDRVGPMERGDLWVLRVAMNLRRKRAKRAWRELAVPPSEVPARHSVDPEPDLSLRACIAALPDRQRAAVVLRYYFDLSEPQCAEVLGVRVGTVAATLSQARRKIAGSTQNRTLDH
jgi:RNA polymerase sigma-70 factor, ECF subfamily